MAAALAPAAAQVEVPRLVMPRALKSGDTVGLITPATYVSDPDALAGAVRTIEYFGLKPKLGRNVSKKYGYLGGTIAERLDDLHAMFADPEVKAVIPVRGGYGSGQLLDGIDYDLIRRNPKVFIGYSDITAMHLAIQRKTGLVTFHGSMAGAHMTPFTAERWRKALFLPEPIGALTNPPEANPLRPSHTMRTVRGGSARGRLAGGNLFLVCETMGTPYEIDTRGAILFLEDVGEEAYRLDRILTQLRLAGKLQQAAGIVWGECSGCGPSNFQPSFESTFSVGEVVDQFFSPLGVPVLSGLVIGHTPDQVTLPYGVMATLDATRQTLTINEAATVA
jgi:muramoyltetrapeptide carboxypeptidase